MTVQREHAAELGLRSTRQRRKKVEGGGGWGRAEWGGSVAPLPSCMLCKSFLAFEAFLTDKEKKRDKNRPTLYNLQVHQVFFFLHNQDTE